MKHTYNFISLLKPLFSSAIVAASVSASAKVTITEIMPSNIATIVSDKYDYNGYVEFYNDGDPIDLKNWYVKNKKGNREKGTEKENWYFRFTESHILPTGYSVMFFGKVETSSEDAKKVNPLYVGSFNKKLTSDEGRLIISTGKGDTITITYPEQHPHLSYSNEGFMEPTPGAENGKAYDIADRVAKPVFGGTKPGLIGAGNTATAELSCPTEGAKILYTLDGSIPTLENGIEYKAPIEISDNTIIRAKAFKDGQLYSDVVTGSYLYLGEYYEECGETTLPIVSIVADSINLYSSTLGSIVVGRNGAPTICSTDNVKKANYHQEWYRPGNFEYFVNGKSVDSQEVEFALQGGCSRSHPVKSFKIKTNKRTGENKFQYDKFFSDRSYSKYKALTLRNGGNGYGYLFPRWRDGYMQNLAKGMNIDLQSYMPVAYFLNGKYHGMMGLRERMDETYIEQNYGIEEDEIDLLKVVNGDGYVAQYGSNEEFYAMLDYAFDHNQDPDFFDNMCKMIDMDSYVDYQILEQFVGNTDWVINNIKVWRKKNGGKWRWMVYDTDFGLSQHTKINQNMISFAQTQGGRTSVYTKLFGGLIKNEDFKYKFVDRFLYAMDKYFNNYRANALIDSMYALTKIDMCATMACPNFGYVGNQGKYDSEIKVMRNFVTNRSEAVQQQLGSFLKVPNELAEVSVRVEFDGAEEPEYTYWVNKNKYENQVFSQQLFVKERVKVDVQLPLGYKVASWTINGTLTEDPTTTMVIDSASAEGTDIQVLLTKDENFSIPRLYINEVCAINVATEDEFGSKPDWIEIYNSEAHDVDLAGMVVKNETVGMSSTIPFGSSSTVIPAKGHVVLWADKGKNDSPLHLNFKLNADLGQKLQLIMPLASGDTLIDEMTYVKFDKKTERNYSFGRATDGDTAMVKFIGCTDEESYGIKMNSPRAANGSILCSQENLVDVEQIDAAEEILVYPNPTSTAWTFNAEGSYVVTNMLGQVIESGEAEIGAQFGENYPVGMYVLRIEGTAIKIVKQ
ncbi:MAG: CotH kinase family protein [Bacteroidales bacterium]|nr:CotH kinase family protein [Candidatus Scybalocola fimicaballi]